MIDCKHIDQMHPCFDEKEAHALFDYIMQGGWVTEFKKTREFENAICAFTGAKYCSILPNGTITLSVALQVLGIGQGDDVIVPDYTMVATPNSVKLVGANVVFADIESDTLCIDIESVKRVITNKTKALMLVSINGRMPKRLKELMAFCEEKNITIIEDAAQSLGSLHNGIQIGRFGKLGSFSFSAPKIITTGQGGCLITDDADIYKSIQYIRDFGRSTGGIDHYLTLGWNYKFTDVQAIIGLEQMKKLTMRIQRKKEIGEIYHNRLSDYISMIKDDYTQTVPWFFDIFINDRENLMQYLLEQGINTRKFYPALHAEPAYGLYKLKFPATEHISKTGLWLPSSSDLTNDDIYYIIDNIIRYYQ
jgi:perosamine synthetase